MSKFSKKAFSKSLAEAALEATEKGIMIVDLNRQVININSSLADIFAIPADILAFHDDAKLLDCIADQFMDRPGFFAKLEQLSKHPAVDSNDTVYINDGRILRRTTRPMYIDGKAVACLWSFQDISEIERAHETLNREVGFKNTLIYSLPHLVWMKDPEGVYLSCNKLFEDFVGAKEKEIVGKTDYDFVDSDLADSFRAHDLEAIKASQPLVNEEWVTFASNGQKLLLQTTKTAMRDTDGKLLGVLGVAYDITASRQQQNLLKTSELRLKEAQHLSRMGHWELDFSTNELYWSDEVFKIFEIDPLRFGANYAFFLESVHPEDREMVNQAFQKALDEQKPYQIDHRLLIDGRVKYVHETGKTFYDETGIPVRSVGTVQDITSRRRSEALIYRLDQVMQSSPDGIFIHDGETSKVIDVNETACRLLGYSREELLKMHVWDFADAVKNEEAWRAMRPVFLENAGRSIEDVHHARDGSLIPVEVISRFIDDEEGGYFIASVRDIRDRQKMQKAALDNSQLYQGVKNSIKDGFWVVDETGFILEANQAYCDYSGYSLVELEGKHVSELDAIDTPEIARDRIGKVKVEKSDIFETMHLRKDGSKWPVEVAISYSQLNNGRYFVFLRDISDRRALEQKIDQHSRFLQKEVDKRTFELEKAKIKAEQANYEKSRFLANMSHELRTPMHAILSFAALGLKHVENAKVERFLQNIRTSGIRLTTLLNDLLDLSKLEAGKMVADLIEQDLVAMIEQVRVELKALLAEKSIKLHLNTQDPVNCSLDQKLMTQVFVNLFSNAIKFSPAFSEIQVEISIADTGEFIREPYVLIKVIDEGVGIPEEQLDDVFDKFVQSSKTRSQAGGTGLGLPITREIIELHHGRIWAESPVKAGKGSAFCIEIPLRPPTLLENIDEALHSHEQWKLLVEAVMRGESISDVPSKTFADEHLCPLGQWIDAIQDDSVISAQDLASLKKTHAQFHHLAAEMIALYQTGQGDQLEDLHTRFEAVSGRVIDLLSSLKN